MPTASSGLWRSRLMRFCWPPCRRSPRRSWRPPGGIAGLLEAAGIDCLIDDREQRPGFKFKDADLIGFPLRIAIGAKSLANGHLEWSWRKDRAKQLGSPDEVLKIVVDAVNGARV